MEALKKLKMDSKGRISLGKLVGPQVTGFTAFKDNGKIVLEPMVDIPERELWLFNNRKAFESVKRGLNDATQGKTSKLDLSLLDNED